MINKKGKKKLVLGILLFILVICSIAGFFYLEDKKISGISSLAVSLDSDLGECSGGWTSFSIDDVSVNSDGRIRVYGVAKGSECMKISLDKEDLNEYLEDEGLEATEDIYGSIKLVDYTKVFPITKTGNTFSKVSSSSIGGVLTYCSLSACKEEYSTSFYFYRTSIFGDCKCLYKETNGIEGSFSSAKSYGEFEAQFKLDGATATITEDEQSVRIGNNYIEWTGNLMNLNEVSVPQYDARLISSVWSLVEDGARNDIENEINTLKNCITQRESSSNVISETNFNYCLNEFQSSSTSSIVDKLDKYLEDNSDLIYDASTDSNALYVSLKATPFPTFILDLDAKSVGIIALSGEPEITSCIEDQELNSGENKQVTFSVKNNGNADNVQFYGSIECDEGVAGYVSEFYIDAGETKTITSELIPSNPNQGTLYSNCELKISDLKSGDSDSCNFDVDVAYESGITCTALKRYCDDSNENLMRCSSDGKNLVLEQECDYGCKYTSSGAICSNETVVETEYCADCEAYAKGLIFGWLSDSQNCKSKTFQNTYFCIFAILKLFAVPIFLILSLAFGIPFFTKLLGKRNTALIWIISLISAFIIALLTYYIFYVGVTIIIIYLILRLAINFIPGVNVLKRLR